MVLWVGFTGASLATRERRHIAIDFLPNILPATWRRSIGIFTKFCAAVICIFLARAAWSFVAYEREAESVLFLNLPVWIFQIVLPYSFILITLRFILSALEDLLPFRRESRCTLLIVGVIVLLAFLGTPLFAVIGLAGLISFHAAEIDSAAIFIELYRIAGSPTLIAIPLFTFAGFILANGKTPERLARLSQAILGGIPGGVPLVVLVACAFFTAFTGASGVTIIALGGLLYPLMLKEMYSKDFSLGLMTSSGSLGLSLSLLPCR